MITISLRMDKKRLAALVLALALAGAGAVCAKQMLWQNVLPAESTVSARKVNTAAANEQQRRDFMAAYGWEVEEEPLEIQEVLIPSEFDETYEKYNYIQKQQGFDLEACCGKQVTRYTYAVSNYPGRPDGVQLNLYVCEEFPVAGDVVCTGADGFRDTLAFPAGAEA